MNKEIFMAQGSPIQYDENLMDLAAWMKKVLIEICLVIASE
jgi:hypothetical protein